MSVTLFCLTSECDFQFVQVPSASALNECPKCHGRAFSSVKGALGQHPYHTDDVPCLVCTLSEEIARLRVEVDEWRSGAHADETGHLHRCAKVNGVWACAKGCAVTRAEKAEAVVRAAERYQNASKSGAWPRDRMKELTTASHELDQALAADREQA